MSTSWVAEIVFKSSTYKLIKYYYSENEGAFKINKDGITNNNGTFKYEIVDTQSGGKISFKKGDNTSSTYTKLFFVIYDGSTEFADNNMKVHECTSATDNGSYTYEGLNGNSLTSITFTNMKVDRSDLNAITGVEEAPAAETQVVPESPETKAPAAKPVVAAVAPVVAQDKPVVEETHEEEAKIKEANEQNKILLRNKMGQIQIYIPYTMFGDDISDSEIDINYDITFNTEISKACQKCQKKLGRDGYGSVMRIGKGDDGKNNHVHAPVSSVGFNAGFTDLFTIYNKDNSIITDAIITNALIANLGINVSYEII